MNIYVGNLSWTMTDEDLSNLFTQYGTVTSGKILKDKMNGRSKGFGFVEMEDDEAARTAIANLNETEVMGRKLIVNESQPRQEGEGGGGTRNVLAAAAVAVDTAAVAVAAAAADTAAAAVVAAAADTVAAAVVAAAAEVAVAVAAAAVITGIINLTELSIDIKKSSTPVGDFFCPFI